MLRYFIKQKVSETFLILNNFITFNSDNSVISEVFSFTDYALLCLLKKKIKFE